MSTIKYFQRLVYNKRTKMLMKPCAGCFGFCKETQVATVMIMGFPNSVCEWHLEPLVNSELPVDDQRKDWSSLAFLARFTKGLPPGHKLLMEQQLQTA